jgi:hypothetical protein
LQILEWSIKTKNNKEVFLMDTNLSNDNRLLVSTNQNGQERVDARELHNALEVGIDFSRNK